jgi:hypothetical protein
MTFEINFLRTLNSWQNGWREDQIRKNELAAILVQKCEMLPKIYKEVNQLCFRKRFLHKGEMVDILMNNSKDEGVTSWTTDIRFAERFKDLYKEGAITAAIFEHLPSEDEVVLNISSLWNCSSFQKDLEEFQEREPDNCKALLNFKNLQSEVILKTALRGSEIIALTGFASPFDNLCEEASIPLDKRDELYYKMIDEGTYPLGISYIKDESARRAIQGTINKFLERIQNLA